MATAVNNTTQAPTTTGGTVNKGLAEISENFDTFLKLLTTQLKNQDPTEPLETNEFTNQLAMFSQVQQTVEMNTNLEKLQDLNVNLANLFGENSTKTLESLQQLVELNKAVNPGVYYVGRYVEAEGNQTEISNGYAPMAFKLKSDANSIRINVKDDQGRLVQTLNLTGKEGHQIAMWDGTDNTGAKRTSGKYTFELAAFNDGTAVESTSYTSGTVTGAEFGGDQAKLIVGNNIKINVSDVVSIREAATIVTPDENTPPPTETGNDDTDTTTGGNA